MPENEMLHRFMDYLTDIYITDSKQNLLPSMWAEMASSCERTTNTCESFHSRFFNLYTPSRPPFNV